MKKIFLLFQLLLITSLISASEKTNVETLRISPQKLNLKKFYIGDLKPLERVTLTAEVPGTFHMPNLDIGDFVKKDQIIIKIINKRLQLQLKRAKSNYLLAKAEYERELKLFKKRMSNKAKLDSAKNRFEINQIAFQLINIDVKKSVIKAPFDCFISKKNYENGEYVDSKMGMKAVAEVVNLEKMLVQTAIPEREARYIWLKKAAEVELDAFPEQKIQGEVYHIGVDIDAHNRSFLIDILIDNTNHKLRPGMFARVKLEKQNQDEQIIIPRTALLEKENEKIVFVENNNQVFKRTVKTGEVIKNQIQIISGLKFNEVIVIKGQQFITDKEYVQVIRENN